MLNTLYIPVYIPIFLALIICIIACIVTYVIKKTVPITLKYSTASLFCIALQIFNFGFFRIMFCIPIALLGVAFLLINNYCANYFTPKTKRLNRILYAAYALHGIILPDTNIRGYNYIFCGLVGHQSSALDTPGTYHPFTYYLMERVIYFLYYFAAVLIIAVIVLLIVQLILCKKQQKLNNMHD